MMRFKDVEENKRNIFYKLFELMYFNWMDDEEKAFTYDYLYFHHSYSKIISFLYEEIIDKDLMTMLTQVIIERY